MRLCSDYDNRDILVSYCMSTSTTCIRCYAAPRARALKVVSSRGLILDRDRAIATIPWCSNCELDLTSRQTTRLSKTSFDPSKMFAARRLLARSAGVTRQWPLAQVSALHATARPQVNVGDAVPDVELMENSPGNKVSIAKELKGKGLIIGVSQTNGYCFRHVLTLPPFCSGSSCL